MLTLTGSVLVSISLGIFAWGSCFEICVQKTSVLGTQKMGCEKYMWPAIDAVLLLAIKSSMTKTIEYPAVSLKHSNAPVSYTRALECGASTYF